MNQNQSILIKAVACSYLAVAALGASAASPAEKQEKERISAEYKMEVQKCSTLSGNPRDVCKAEAKAHEDKAEAKLESELHPSAKASKNMQETYADADYKVAMEKCDAFTGNDKDVCKKEAKAAKVMALETAKTNKEITDRKNDAADTKNDAAYSVAKEKCDALAGNAKDKCVADAKLNYGK
ncbi:hypothetical protein VVD49_19115 [Uliginosibacterium sp. H3]|uniref:Cell envelope biogenesis protein TolA n=1 Tax=Uliginosibacterium silvisoli TaxID=3114758 RepID=A0ABU6K8T7_9RHOO|nr:hypothetical protein [Uliginosibacterium sp. H3]